MPLKCVSKQTHTPEFCLATFVNSDTVFVLELLLFRKRRGHVGASGLYSAVITVKVKQTELLRHTTRLIVFRYRQTMVFVGLTAMDEL